MKLSFLFVALLIGQSVFAQTAIEDKRRSEMLITTDKLIDLSSSAMEDLDRKDLVPACQKIQEMFNLHPDHLKSIAFYMDTRKNKIFNAREEALQDLIENHRNKAECERGNGHEFVDIKEMKKSIKKRYKNLMSRRKIIEKKKNSVGFNNSYRYQYRF